MPVSYTHLLHGLTAQLIPLRETASFQLGNMLLQPVGRQMLAIQLVIAPVDGNAVVPDGGSRVDGFIQVAVPLAVVQLIPCLLYTSRPPKHGRSARVQ